MVKLPSPGEEVVTAGISCFFSQITRLRTDFSTFYENVGNGPS